MEVLNFVDGAFQTTAQVLENVAPGSGEKFGTIPRSGTAEVDKALQVLQEVGQSTHRLNSDAQ